MTLSAIRGFFSKIHLPYSAKTPLQADSAINRQPTEGKAHQAATQTFVQPKPSQEKGAPQLRPLHDAEKGSGITFQIAKLFRITFFKNFLGEDPREANPSVKEHPLKSIKNAMDFMGGKALNAASESDGVVVEGEHLRVANLMDRIKESGGRKVVLRKTDAENPNITSSAIVFEKNEVSKDCIAALTAMGFFDQRYKDDKSDKMITVQGPWVWKEVNGKIYVWKREAYNAIQNDLLEKDKKLFFDPSKFHEEAVVGLQPEPKRMTIVLHGGVKSYFDHPRMASEAAQLMDMGFDVVVSQDKKRGMLGSEAHEHVMAARDAIHKHLVENGIANQQIIWKGTCFSSIAAVEAAAKYKGSHVIIDQGYMDSAEIAAKVAVDKLAGYHLVPDFAKPVAIKIAKPIAPYVLPAFDFVYKMEPFLQNVEGNICIIENQNDALVSPGNVFRMRELLEKKKHELLTIANPYVEHGGGWYHDGSCASNLKGYLTKNGFTAQGIL